MNSNDEQLQSLSPLKRSLRALNDMQSKLDQLERAITEPIAIIGMGCRFPGGANNPEAFWQLLRNGINAVREVPTDRWDIEDYYDSNRDTPGKIYSRYGGFLDQVDQFDPEFFRISPREATNMDPQQRLLLEVSWESLEVAGQNFHQLKGSSTGVFVGLNSEDYRQLLLKSGDLTNIDAYSSLGTDRGIAVGRISQYLGLQGPTIQLDTSCSSSLVSVHLACQSLRNKECNLALAGGVNLILSPVSTMRLCRLKALSPDGQCKSFDDSADGMGRGEGCGMIVLKRLSDAIADRDNILALIRGSAINHDGYSSGLTVPNERAQEKVIRQALKNAKVKPAQVSYVEAHGTGTALGDPIEIGALGSVFGPEHSAEDPLVIGSAKTNIGHLESCAGIAGLIKVVLALQHQEIPPNLHFQQANSHIQWSRLPVLVPTDLMPWESPEQQRFAGVSAFGMSGTNAHMVLSEAPALEPAAAELERPLHLFTLSAKTEAALQQLCDRYQQHLNAKTSLSLADVCFTANTGRAHFNHRLSVVAASLTDLVGKLAAFTDEPETLGVFPGQVQRQHQPKIAFLFTGQGSQYIEMGDQLYQTQPTFRNALERCEAILRPYLAQPLLEVLYPKSGQVSPLDETAYSQPALFAIEYALAQLWLSWGIKPQSVMGHSVGEYVAACIAGVFSLEDGLKLIAHRGRLMQALPKGGAMVSLLADVNQVKAAIASYGERVAIAAFNGHNSIVLSGEEQAIEEIVAQLPAESTKSKRLQVSHAFHSSFMSPMLAEFEEIARQITYNKPRIDLISNLTGEIASEKIATPEYWCRHIRQPVRFVEGMETIARKGYEVFIECGAKPILLGMGRQCIEENQGVWLPSLRPGLDDWQQILQSLAQLYVRGIGVDWSKFDQDYQRRKVELPTYAFQRQRYWSEYAQNGTQQSGSLPEPRQSLISKTLNPENIPENILKLKKSGKFSQDEMKLLPKMLEVLLGQNQQSITSSSRADWFYELQWHPQVRFSSILPPDYLPHPATIQEQLLPQVSALVNQPILQGYKQLSQELDALSVAYILKALEAMEWQSQLSTSFSTTQLAEQLGIVSQHGQLLGRLLEILAEAEILSFNGSHWSVIQIPDSCQPEEHKNYLLKQYPAAIAQLNLLERCGSQLASVLRGESDPLELLFPQGDLSSTTSLYENSPVAQVMNTLVQKALASVLEQLPPGRKIRVLEIGAGTGGTTSHLLSQLPPQQTEYVFTDLSPFFLNRAQEKFRDYPFVQYQILDIEQDLASQGFNSDQYDVIVAANVIHATADLGNSLKQIKQLLAPSGILMLLEITAPIGWIDLTFGLTEGWWKFTDRDWRSHYPLIAAEKWQKLLKESGFTAAETITPAPESQEIVWQQAVIVAQAPQLQSQETNYRSRNWLILADQGGIGQQLAAKLQTQGDVPTLVYAGREYQQIGEQTFQIDPTRFEDFQRLLTVANSGDFSLEKIVYLWSLDTTPTAKTTADSLQVDQSLICGSILHLLKVIAQNELSSPPQLWLATQGAQAILSAQQALSVAQASLWGLGRVISLEHPEIWGGLIDLDPDNTESAATELLEELWDVGQQEQVAFRDGQRYVARLLPREKQTSPTKAFSLSADGTYLITGGFTGLGLQLSKWMVELGARHLVMLSQCPISSNCQKQLSKLEELGARVMLIQADISQERELDEVLADISLKLPPLRGIIHLEEIVDDGTLVRQDWQRFNQVMTPKVAGAWNLHNQTQNQPLDFFVLFSSVVSLLGTPTQGNYAAANAFLDALSQYRCSLGLPTLSINWGPSAETAMTEAWNSLGEQRWHEAGVEVIEPQQGIQVLEQLLQQVSPQVCVFPVNWSQFFAQFLTGEEPPLLREIAVNYTSPPKNEPSLVPEQSQLSARLLASPPNQYKSVLITYLQQEVAKVLGRDSSCLPKPQQGFFEMGMDSLMSIEFKNRLEIGLGKSLTSTLTFEYSNIEAVADYLFNDLLSWELAPNGDSQSEQENQEQTEMIAQIEQLSDQELEALIDEELQTLTL